MYGNKLLLLLLLLHWFLGAGPAGQGAGAGFQLPKVEDGPRGLSGSPGEVCTVPEKALTCTRL
jgi:hypothetical protein